MTEVTLKKTRVPHTYVILFCIILLAAIGTYVLPTGVYERQKDERTGRTLVDPTSYHHVERNPVSPFQLFQSVPKGMVAASEIIFFIFICGGVFTILQDTKAIDAALSKVIIKMKGKEKLMIPVTMFIFSAMGATMGMSEEVIVFIPIGVALARAVGYDDIVAVAMMGTGANIGFSAGMLNPFTVGVAQSIAELPMFSGLAFRSVGYVILYIAAVWYTLRYANKVKENPDLSYVRDEMRANAEANRLTEDIEFTTTHKLVGLVCIGFLVFMVYGVIEFG
ncbi:C4-dicarboxylate ABC transporter permease, partial [Synergistaceae bacterium OttesenSCG-928-I11]|nr:C4-dicarboxylate ABC transporter permease [Synergistaceae bacterium OttesenSCG-928-I11]